MPNYVTNENQMNLEIKTPSETCNDLFTAIKNLGTCSGYRLLVATLGEVQIYAKLTRRNAVASGFRGSMVPVVFGFSKNKFSTLTHWSDKRAHFFADKVEYAIQGLVDQALATYAK